MVSLSALFVKTTRFIFVFLFFACTESDHKNSGSNERISFEIIDSYEVDLSDYAIDLTSGISKLAIRQKNDSAYLDFFCRADSSFHSINLFSKKSTAVDLKEFLQNKNSDVAFYGIIPDPSKAGIVLLTPENNMYRVDVNGEKIDFIDFNIDDAVKHYQFQTNPILIDSTSFFILRAYEDLALTSKRSRANYYGRGSFSQFSMLGKTASPVSSFPPCFDKNPEYLKNVYTQLAFTHDSSQILSGFKDCEDVLIYHRKLDSTEVINGFKSNPEPKFQLLHEDDISNIKKKQITELSSAAYLNLISDPYRKLYYRSFKGFTNLSDSITLPPLEAMPYSLRIWDNTFKYLGEVDLTKENLYPYQVLPMRNGLLFMKWNKNSNIPNRFKLKFELYNIEIRG